MKVVGTAIILDTDPEHAKLQALFASTDKIGIDFYVIALDDRSVEGTAEWIRKRLKKRRCDVFSYTWSEDFSAARNLTLQRLPKNTDWWTWFDSDDTVEANDGQSVQQFLTDIPDTVSAVFCNYDYDRDEYGNSSCILTRGRFYRAGVAWQWRDRVHEDVYPPEGRDWPELGLVQSTAFIWKHDTGERPSASERNFRLLRKSIEEEPNKPRLWYYLANQHFAVHEWLDAIEAYDKYLALSNWTEQRWDALIRQAIAYRSLGMLDEAIAADTRAIHTKPEWADSYFGLGESYTRRQEWSKAIQFGEWGLARVASKSGVPDPTVFVNMNAYFHNPYRWLAVAYFNLGRNEDALRALKTAAETRPEPELLRQIDATEWSMRRRQIIDQGLNLTAGLIRRNEPIKAKAILDNLPAGAAEESNVRLAYRAVGRRLQHLTDSTAYQNLYFTEPESVKPEDAIEYIDELPRMKWVLRRLRAMGAKKVLEVGIGNAAQALYLASNGVQVVGIDIDRRRVRDANLSAMRMGLVKSKEIDLGDDEEHSIVTVPNLLRDSQVQFHYCAVEDVLEKRVILSDDSEVRIMDLGPFDAVTATEIIEHVSDPDALLDAVEKGAPRVFVSTPDGAWDGRMSENDQHVRAYSYADLARLLSPRGRLHEIHHLDNPYAGEQRNLLAEYAVGEPMPREAVIIWCPDTGQEWTPDAIREGGIGGSETAVIRMAEELVKRGKRVTVYAECEGVWAGVRYALSKNFRPQPCDLFVSWRTAYPLKEMREFANHRFLWTHDTDFGDATEEDLAGVTVLALSKWHKDFLTQRYPNADIVITANGIDPERFEKEVKRVQHRLIYASSPDRGLERVLRLFPRVREVYPDATLAVFYGFELARKHNPGFVAEVERLARQPGVTLNGRIGQDRLADEYLASDALIYPASMPDGKPFNETYYIGGVEAAAAGVFRVTADHGVLREHIGAAHCRLDTFDHDSIFQLLAFWRRPLKEQERIRRDGQKWAVQQTWAKVADQWCALIAPKVQAESAAD